MPISQLGLLNTTALVVPGVYVQIVPPQNTIINGVPTNLLGVVGTASWGPVNSPTGFGTPEEGTSIFGPMVARKYDMMTVANVAALQGATNFMGVRVTDGTDTAAAATISISSTAAITFTSRYTGSAGNNISVTLATGSAANSWSAVVACNGIGLAPEKFNNITGTGAALWANIAAAINSGQSGLRGPSGIIVATAGTSASAPTAGTTTLSGGADGATPGTGHIVVATLVGSDSATPRTGMYSLRGQGCSVGVLADADDTTQWTYQNAFGLSEGVYMIGTTPSGDTISNAVSEKSTAGIDSYGFKLMLGDWPQIYDQTNSVYRLVAPSGFIAGQLSALSPQNSTLNQPLNGIVTTQRQQTGQAYASADIQQLELAGIDVIANPSPGGTYFAAQTGNNSSSNASVNGDNYTRMTNYIATSINASAGQFIGQTNTPTLQAQFAASLSNFFINMLKQGLLAYQINANGQQTYPFQVVCNFTNNPPSRVSQGYLQADIQIVYESIVTKLIVNIQGGQSVTITTVSTQSI